MSAQDKTEQVLREMHIMYANSEVYDKATNRVIIDKKEALNLPQRLNVCILGVIVGVDFLTCPLFINFRFDCPR